MILNVYDYAFLYFIGNIYAQTFVTCLHIYGQDWTGTPISLTYCVHICILMLDPCAVERTICMHLSQVSTLACVPKCMHTYLHIHYIMNITTAVKKQTHITIW